MGSARARPQRDTSPFWVRTSVPQSRIQDPEREGRRSGYCHRCPSTGSSTQNGGPTLAAVRLRSLLFAPGNKGEVLAKLPRSGPDGVVLDLEDAVPADAKAEARAVGGGGGADARRRTRPGGLRPGQRRADASGSPTTWPRRCPRDRRASSCPSWSRPSSGRRALARRPVRSIVPGIETAAGVARAEEVLADDRVVAGYFGAEDFIADMGGVRTAEGTEVLYARSQVALAARLDRQPRHRPGRHRPRATRSGSEPTPPSAGRSATGASSASTPPRWPGPTRPSRPSPDELDRARRLLAAYDEATAAGRRRHRVRGPDGRRAPRPPGPGPRGQ